MKSRVRFEGVSKSRGQGEATALEERTVASDATNKSQRNQDKMTQEQPRQHRGTPPRTEGYQKPVTTDLMRPNDKRLPSTIHSDINQLDTRSIS
jgi:hypothetical protein